MGGRRDQADRGEGQEHPERHAQARAGSGRREARAENHSGHGAEDEVERDRQIDALERVVGARRDEGADDDEGERGALRLVLVLVENVDKERDEDCAAPDTHHPAQGAGHSPQQEQKGAPLHGLNAEPITPGPGLIP